MREIKREFEEAFENEKDLEITLSKAMTYILYLERETQSLEEQNKELREVIEKIMYNICTDCTDSSLHQYDWKGCCIGCSTLKPGVDALEKYK